MAHGVLPLHVVYDDALAGQTNRVVPTRFSAVPQLPPSLALSPLDGTINIGPSHRLWTGTWEGMIFASNRAGETAVRLRLAVLPPRRTAKPTPVPTPPTPAPC